MKIYVRYKVKPIDRSTMKQVVVVCDTLEDALMVYVDAKSLSGISHLSYSTVNRVVGTYQLKSYDGYFKEPY